MTTRKMTALSVENARPNKKKRLEIPDATPGLYLVIQPSGTKSWAFRYRIGGKPRKLTLGSLFVSLDPDAKPPKVKLGGLLTLAGARKLAADAANDVASGDDPAVKRKAQKRAEKDAVALAEQAGRDTIEAVAKAFLARHVANLRKATAEQYAHVLSGIVMPAWRGRTINEIARRDVKDLLDGIKSAGKPVMANRTLAVVSALYSWAQDEDIINTVSPCAGVKRPHKETARERALSDDELRLVWKAAEAVGWPFGPLAKLLILTGARRREVAGMKWAEVDASARVWNLPAERSKNGRAHAIPLSDQAVAVLEGLPKIGAAKAGFVLTTSGDTAISGFGRAKERIDAAIERLKREEAEAAGRDPDEVEPIAQWQFHDLRRTVASGLGKLGFPGEVIERSLNHVSGKFGGIAGVYQRHKYEDETRAALAAWAQHAEALATGQAAANVVALRRGAWGGVMAKSPRWKKPVGSGSTQKIVAAVGPGMSAKEMNEALSFAASVATFERAVADIEQYCRGILADKGIDLENESYSTKDANRQNATYYACTILRYLSIIRDRIASDAPRPTKDVTNECALYGLRLGLTIREWQMKGLADRGLYASREDGRAQPRQGKNPRGRLAKVEDKPERDKRMRADFAERRKTSRLSDSALMTDIGSKQKPPLQKSQSITIISKLT